MSTVVRPSGPLSPRVYWVRRLLLLVVVAALVWGVVRVVGGSDPASGEPAGDTAPATPEASSDDQATQQTKSTPRELREKRRRVRLAERAKLRRSQQVRDVVQALDVPAGPCDLTLVRVAPQVPSPAYAGTSVLLRLGLRTEQATPCTVDLDADRLLVSVSSVEQAVVDDVSSEATEIVWSTAQCGDAVPRRTVVLRPSWTSTVDLAWSGLRSGLRCRPDGKPVDAGSYRLQAAALTGEPAAVDFDLLDPLSLDRPVTEPAPEDGPGPDDDAEAGDQADDSGGQADDAGAGEQDGDESQPAGQDPGAEPDDDAPGDGVQ
jgi:hypothetical protein